MPAPRRGRPLKGKEKTWSYSVGKRGRNRVRVYEARPGGALMVQYTTRDGQMIREALSAWTAEGSPVHARDVAKNIATSISLRLAEATDSDQLRGFMGRSKRRTLGQLLSTYHDARGPKWSQKHRNEQEEWRRLFTNALGEARQIDTVTPGAVETVVREEMSLASPSRRSKALKYMVATFRYARRTLKWLVESDDLSAVSLPAVEAGVGQAFTDAELNRLIPVMIDVDLRLALTGEIMDHTARRLNSIRQLTPDNFSIIRGPDENGDIVDALCVLFEEDHDKATKASRIPLSPRAADLYRMLIATPAVQATGQLFVSGDLDDPSRYRVHRGQRGLRGLIDLSELIDFLHEAEALAGVEHQQHRGFHGIKRRVVTRSLQSGMSIEVLSALSGTSPSTLRKHYNKMGQEPEALIKYTRRGA